MPNRGHARTPNPDDSNKSNQDHSNGANPDNSNKPNQDPSNRRPEHRTNSHEPEAPPAPTPALAPTPAPAVGAADLLKWAREFLPDYFTDEPAPFHHELMADLASDERLIARVAPRGHAKSTCAALAYPLWCICEQKRRNIVIITHESSLATQFVRDIRHELETNERIRAQYGDLLAPAVGGAVPTSSPPAFATRSPSASEREAPASGKSNRTGNANDSATVADSAPARPKARPRTTPKPMKSAAKASAARSSSPRRPATTRKSARCKISAPTPAPTPAVPKPPARRRKATQSLLLTATGVSVQAKSTGASFRGARIGPNRPDLIICDDIEKDEHVETPAGRAKLESWLRRVVMPALAPSGKIVVLGSLIHYDSLLANLRDPLRFPRWNYKVYRALEARPIGVTATSAPIADQPNVPAALRADREISADAPASQSASAPHTTAPSPTEFELIPLWPARWPLARLQLERERVGTRAFEQEYQANPVDDSVRVFRPEWLRRYDPRDLNPARLVNLIAVDPATGAAGGDFFALWVGSVDADTGIIYTRELTLERIGIVDQIKRIRAAHRVWRPAKIGVETTAYQAALKQILDDISCREHDYLPVFPIHAIGNKRARIEGSAPFYENGTFRLPPLLCPEAEAQFLQFPKSRHDDAPDVCAMGIELARSIHLGRPVEFLLPSNGDSRRRDLW